MCGKLSMLSRSGTAVRPAIRVIIRLCEIPGSVYSRFRSAAAPKHALTPGQLSWKSPLLQVHPSVHAPPCRDSAPGVKPHGGKPFSSRLPDDRKHFLQRHFCAVIDLCPASGIRKKLRIHERSRIDNDIRLLQQSSFRGP